MNRTIRVWRAPIRFFSDTVKSNTNITSKSSAPKVELNATSLSQAPKVNENVPGLSPACFNSLSGPVGPDVDLNKNGPYKAPEYYCYNNMSFFEAEVEMTKYRLPQPSALKK